MTKCKNILNFTQTMHYTFVQVLLFVQYGGKDDIIISTYQA